jgi:hypothetical protein
MNQHERTAKVHKARMDIESAFLEIRRKHGLTSTEFLSILVESMATLFRSSILVESMATDLKFLLREERHPEDPSRPAEWFESRPPAVRALFRRFPPGSTFSIDGRTAFLISIVEMLNNLGMMMSYTDPAEDYDKAFATRFFVCWEHMR